MPQRFRTIELDAFVLMPNHLHGVIVIGDGHPTPTPSLHEIVGAFKSDATRRINRVTGAPGVTVWQRSFHDQIIRDARHLANVREYIARNPANWHADEENPIDLK
ncbi:MAG: transposase [Vicinamibacterales bacterium]